jgi:hypothetical protein
MKRLFLFLLLVPVGAAVIWSMEGCGARTEVAVARVAEQIDDLLGRLDVKRTAIERSLATLKQGQTGLRRARIRAQVKQDQLQRKMGPVERRMSGIDESLDVLRGHLADGTPAELAGKTYPVAQVRVMAERLLEARRLSVRQVDGYPQTTLQLKSNTGSAIEARQKQPWFAIDELTDDTAVPDHTQNRVLDYLFIDLNEVDCLPSRLVRENHNDRHRPTHGACNELRPWHGTDCYDRFPDWQPVHPPS